VATEATVTMDAVKSKVLTTFGIPKDKQVICCVLFMIGSCVVCMWSCMCV
jgi:hypothetical protein